MIDKKVSVLGMLVMVLVFGLVLFSCDTGTSDFTNGGGGEPNSEPKTIIITGFNLEGKTPTKGDIIDTDWNNWKVYASGGVEPGNNYKDGIITLYLWNNDGSGRFTGTGLYSLLVTVTDGESRSTYVFNGAVDIKKAETTVEWSDFEFGWD